MARTNNGEGQGRAVTNVGKTCGPTPCFVLAINTFKLTNNGLKGTYILKACSFLPAGTADTGSIASLMQI